MKIINSSIYRSPSPGLEVLEDIRPDDLELHLNEDGGHTHIDQVLVFNFFFRFLHFFFISY